MASQPILVVDDDEAIRELVNTVLTDEGYTVVTAASGPAALDLTVQHRPALVLLDLHMPGMSGQAVHQVLRRQWPELPVVYVTADLRGRWDGSMLGAAAFLAKPFDLDDLLAIVESFVSRDQTSVAA